MSTKTISLALLGFGNVHQAFVDILLTKADFIRQNYGLELRVTGIATKSHGVAINPDGLDTAQARRLDDLSVLHRGPIVADIAEFIRACPADILLEGTWVNPQTGQPALEYCRIALESGKHVVTANKGPVAFGFRELSALAKAKNLAFFFESTVMDGQPLNSLAREGLLAAEIHRIRGVLNSTTNAILHAMENGIAFDAALKTLQEAGIAEANPDNDIDGWDAAIKITILANTLMGADLRPADVLRTGIRDITAESLMAALTRGERLKLLCEAWREGGQIRASVKPMTLPLDDALARLDHTASGVTIFTDMLEQITLSEVASGPRPTAYGLLVDTLNIARGRRAW